MWPARPGLHGTMSSKCRAKTCFNQWWPSQDFLIRNKLCSVFVPTDSRCIPNGVDFSLHYAPITLSARRPTLFETMESLSPPTEEERVRGSEEYVSVIFMGSLPTVPDTAWIQGDVSSQDCSQLSTQSTSHFAVAKNLLPFKINSLPKFGGTHRPRCELQVCFDLTARRSSLPVRQNWLFSQ